MEALRSCLSRTSVICLMLVSSIVSVSVFKSLSCFSGSVVGGEFAGGSVFGKSSPESWISAGSADVWLSRVCRECVWETNAPSTIWSPDASICVVMSAHSCMQKFLEYIVVCSDRRRYVDSSSPRSCACPR